MLNTLINILVWYLILCYAPLLIPGYSSLVWEEARMQAAVICKDLDESEREAAIDSVTNFRAQFTPITLMSAFILIAIGSWTGALCMFIGRLF